MSSGPYANIKALCLDLDGLLVNSEALGLASFEASCTAHGMKLDRGIYTDSLGLVAADGERHFRTRLKGRVADVNRFLEEWEARFVSALESPAFSLMPGAEAVLRHAHECGLQVALATSSRRSEALGKLERVGLLDYFHVIAAGDEVSFGKPAPDIYRLAAQRLGVSPSEALACEDANHGVNAALSAGMSVVHVPGLVPPPEQGWPENVRVLETLESLPELLTR